MRGIHGLLYLNVDTVGQFNVFGDDTVSTGVSFKKLFLNLSDDVVFLGFDFVKVLILLFLCLCFPFLIIYGRVIYLGAALSYLCPEVHICTKI
jgi:hypothetical protein